MRNINKKSSIYFFMVLMTLTFFFWGQDALAADSSGNWRHTYDRVMRLSNFAILAFLIVKFTKPLIVNFLRGQKEKIERQIKQIEKEKALVTDKIQETVKIADQSDVTLEKLKERIATQGKRKKNQIIAEAQIESRLILEEAKRRIDNQIIRAKNILKAELVDTAIGLAIDKLPKEITKEDDQKIIQDYLTTISSK